MLVDAAVLRLIESPGHVQAMLSWVCCSWGLEPTDHSSAGVVCERGGVASRWVIAAQHRPSELGSKSHTDALHLVDRNGGEVVRAPASEFSACM